MDGPLQKKTQDKWCLTWLVCFDTMIQCAVSVTGNPVYSFQESQQNKNGKQLFMPEKGGK